MICSNIDKITLEDFDGNYNLYEDYIFQLFMENYIYNNIYYKDERIMFKKFPIENGKSEAFWHMTSTTEKTGDRLPDMRRYETVHYTKYILNHCFPNPNLCNKSWVKKFRSKKRILILCEAIDYLVVLEVRKTYILFITSYPVNERRKNKLIKEYESDLVERIT